MSKRKSTCRGTRLCAQESGAHTEIVLGEDRSDVRRSKRSALPTSSGGASGVDILVRVLACWGKQGTWLALALYRQGNTSTALRQRCTRAVSALVLHPACDHGGHRGRGSLIASVCQHLVGVRRSSRLAHVKKHVTRKRFCGALKAGHRICTAAQARAHMESGHYARREGGNLAFA
jgi:hypothetical protein